MGLNIQKNVNKEIKIKFLMFIVLIGISFLSVFPIFWMGHLNYGYDTEFHYARLQGLSNYFTSPVNFQNFGNQGKMVNVFYPPLTILPAQIIYYVVHDFVLMYKLTWLYVAFLNVFIAYFVSYKYKKDRLISLIFTILWTFSVSKINKEIGSGAISNVLAYSFFPMVIYGLICIFEPKKYTHWWFFPLGIIAIIYTHIMSFVLFSYFILFIIIFMIIMKKIKWLQIKLFLISSIFIVFMSLGTFLPIFEQMQANEIFTAAINPFPTKNSLLEWILSNITNFDMLGWVGLICMSWSWFKFKRLNSFYKSLTLTATIFIIITNEIFPWHLIIKLPLLGALQFTYRLFTYSNIAFISIFAYNFNWKNFSNTSNVKLICSIGIFTILTFIIQLMTIHIFKFNLPNVKKQLVHPVLNNPNEFLNMKHQDYTNKGYDYGIYLNKNVDQNWLKELCYHRNEFVLNGDIIDVKQDVTPNTLKISLLNNKSDSILMMPQSLYKGLIIKVNNHDIRPTLSKYKGIQITLPNVKKIVITLTYKYTFLARISQIISLLSLIIFLLFIKYKKRK